MRLRALCLAWTLTWTAGCTKAPFTTAVLERYGLTAGDLSRVQFFNSESIVLEREVDRQTRVNSGSELSFRGDLETEVVEVSEHTPCVVLRVEGDYLLLGFSPKDENAALWFAAQAGDDASGANAAGRRYVLVALENGYRDGDPSAPFAPRWSKGYLVSWSGHKYHIASGREAYLLYELSDDVARRKVERSAPGWRLSERGPSRSVTATPPKAAGEADVQIEVEP